LRTGLACKRAAFPSLSILFRGRFAPAERANFNVLNEGRELVRKAFLTKREFRGLDG
jgi:hypothetical protein